MSTTLSGYFLRASTAQTLRSTVSADRGPRYVALMFSQDAVKRLVAALAAPAETTYASCELARNGNSGVAVPFTALRAEAQFALDCIYLFRPQDVPQHVHCQWLTYGVTDFAPSGQAEGAHITLPLSIAPPWEALPPAYVCCMAQPGRVALLQQVLKPGAQLESATLLVDDRDPRYRVYQAAALGDLLEGARGQLEQADRPIWYCLYDNSLGGHPLLKHYWRRFEVCRVGEER